MKQHLFYFLIGILACFTKALSPLMVKQLRRAVNAQRRHEQQMHNPPPVVDDKLDLRKLQQEWTRELEHLQQYEHSILSDPDLAGVVETTQHATTTLSQSEQHVPFRDERPTSKIDDRIKTTQTLVGDEQQLDTMAHLDLGLTMPMP